MQDFLGQEVKLNDRVFVSWGGKRHAIGQVVKLVGSKTIEISNFERSSNPIIDSDTDVVVFRAADCVVLPKT